jgi:NAD(P)-dependent dehydrogenase (short-subunit alcohol dehydrogenase family)
MDLHLKGKIALVTGAGSQVGFGKAICLTLAGEGCSVVVADINLEGAQKTALEIDPTGIKSMAVKADITIESDLRTMVKTALEKFGKIDILVNNAGGMIRTGPFLEQDESSWDKDLALNLKGTMLCCKAVLPCMIERKYGKIVNISSSSAKVVNPMVGMYAIAKGGVYIFTRSLAKMVIDKGITVNSIAPGWSMTTDFVKGDSKKKEDLKARFLPDTPIGRGTEPEDIANSVAFLVSDVSSDIVGQVICVDGGSTMQ